MARYIDADKLVHAIKLYANRTSLGQICLPDLSYSEMLDIIADASTADVVPRAEVERLQHNLDSYALQYGTVKDQREVMDRIKQDTAREIFEVIEKCLVEGSTFYGDLIYSISVTTFAKLKKKYTEDRK